MKTKNYNKKNTRKTKGKREEKGKKRAIVPLYSKERTLVYKAISYGLD